MGGSKYRAEKGLASGQQKGANTDKVAAWRVIKNVNEGNKLGFNGRCSDVFTASVESKSAAQVRWITVPHSGVHSPVCGQLQLQSPLFGPARLCAPLTTVHYALSHFLPRQPNASASREGLLRPGTA